MAKLIGYARVSTRQQTTDRQEADLLAAGSAATAINGARLTQVAATYTAATSVTHAVARSVSGRVTLDFGCSTGTGQTRSHLLMADLLATTVPLVVTLEGDHDADLAEFLAYDTGPDDLTAVTLFDELFDGGPDGI